MVLPRRFWYHYGVMGKSHHKATEPGIGPAAEPPLVIRPAYTTLFTVTALLVLTALAYVPAARCGYIWDDEQYVVDNTTLRSLAGLKQIWLDPKATPQYYPMVHTTYWLEYHIWQLDPAGYHVVNIALHAIAAILLWRILVFLNIPAAALAAAIFAIHPVHVESVAWITERKNVLSGVFYLAAALVYLRWALGAKRLPRKKHIAVYVAALVLFVFALLSKTVTSTLPAVLLLILWWKRDRLVGKDVLSLAPFFALGITFGIITAVLERSHVGAIGEEFQLSVIQRCLIAGRVPWFYMSKLLWPAKLAFTYPRWSVDAAVLWQYIFPAATIGAVIVLWFGRRRIGKGPLVAVLFFIGTLFPALGFFNVYPFRFSFVADHFQYLASIGPITLAAAAGYVLWRRLDEDTKSVAAICLAGVLAVFVAISARQCRAYTNLETLWRDTINKNPKAWLAQNNLGTLLTRKGELNEALEHYRAAVDINPRYVEAVNNLGWALATHPDPNLRDPREAVALARRAGDLLGQLNGYILDTMAAGYAGMGEFEKAAKLAKLARHVGCPVSTEQWSKKVTSRIELYEQKKPYIAKMAPALSVDE